MTFSLGRQTLTLDSTNQMKLILTFENGEIRYKPQFLCSRGNFYRSEGGDLVLISSKDIPRSNWPLARKLDIYRGEDDVISVIKIKTKDSVYMRPVAKLCLLEACN